MLSNSARQWLSGGLLEPLQWRAKRLPVFSIFRDFQQHQWQTQQVWRERQRQQLTQLMLHATGSVDYYSRAAHKLAISAADIQQDPEAALRNLPILSKDILRNEIDALRVEIGRGTFKNSSGGSTGQPTIVYQDRVYLAHSLASTLLMFEWAGASLGARKVKLWGAERDLQHGGAGWKQRLSDFIGNRLTLNSFGMSAERMSQYLHSINKFRPVVVEGYADSLFELSRFSRQEKIAIQPPTSVVSSAGSLYPHMREEVEAAFGCPVFDRYGGREVGNVAAECDAHSGLHVFGENTYVEVVDENGIEVSAGESGRLLLTTLRNFTMPLLRYEVGDIAVKSADRCSCGRPYPLLARIEGRQSGSILRSDGGVVSPVFFVHCMGVMCNDGSVDTFQVVQTELGKLRLLLKPFGELQVDSWPMRERIQDLIDKAMGEHCEIEFEVVDEIALTPTGKHLYTICNIDRQP